MRIYPQGGIGNSLCKEHGKKSHMDVLSLPHTSKIRCTIKTEPSSAVNLDVFGEIRILTPATSCTVF